MIFKPFYRDETGCAAYVFGCGGCGLGAAVDPQERDVETYVEFARAKGLRLTHVIDTHALADHRSGGRRLAEITGARYCLHRSADVAFPFEPLDDGQEIELSPRSCSGFRESSRSTPRITRARRVASA